MKILGVTLIAVTIFAFIFWGVFYYSARLSGEAVTLPQETTVATSSSIKSTPKAQTTTTTIPENFKGPTSTPSIIGPKSNPPNY
jgi:hypothetical protein